MVASKLHHFGVAVNDLEKARALYEAALGYTVVSDQVDDSMQRVSICLLARGVDEPIIELVAPLVSGSPIDRILRSGGGIYHLCYEVADIEQTVSGLVQAGATLISQPVPATAFGGRLIAWVMIEELLVEVLQR